MIGVRLTPSWRTEVRHNERRAKHVQAQISVFGTLVVAVPFIEEAGVVAIIA